MSALVCSLSGSPLLNPVVSSKSGHLYEKSTILHFLSVNGCCPHTGVPMTPEDLVELAHSNTQVVSGQPTLAGLADKLSAEMDVLILEAHMLKGQLRERREQLATSLYRQDAAIRVVATLKQERDNARAKVSTLMEEVRLLENQ